MFDVGVCEKVLMNGLNRIRWVNSMYLVTSPDDVVMSKQSILRRWICVYIFHYWEAAFFASFSTWDDSERKKLYTAIAPFIRDDYTSCCGQVMLDDINQIGQHISLSQFHIWWGERSTLVFITSIKRLCNSGWALLFEDLHLVRGNFSFGRQICHMPFRWEGLDGNKQKSLWKSN
jgi:hypothetical protein